MGTCIGGRHRMAQSGADQLPSGDTQGSFSPFLTLLPEGKARKSPNSLWCLCYHKFQLAPDSKWHFVALSLSLISGMLEWLVSKWKPYHLCAPFPEWHVVPVCGDHLPSDFCNWVHTRLNKLHPRPAWFKSVTFPMYHSSVPSCAYLLFFPRTPW